MFEKFSASLEGVTQKLHTWVDGLINMLPNILLAIFVFGISLILVRFIKRWVDKALNRYSNNTSVNSLLSTFAAILFMAGAIFIILGILNLDKTLTTLLGTAGIAGLAIGLALQDPLTNAFSGIILSMKDTYNIGDVIESNNIFGVIYKFNLRSTYIRTPLGEMVSIPNKLIVQNPLTNYSYFGRRRVVVSCGVSYGDELEKVEALVIRTIAQEFGQDEEDIEFFFTEYGDSSVNFITRFWIDEVAQAKYRAATSKGIKAVRKAFDENGITIPFPIRTLDFGVVGGKALDQLGPIPIGEIKGDDN